MCAAQVEHVIRCPASAYQRGLCALVQRGLEEEGAPDQAGGRAGGLRGVNNSMMELRNICNHPFLASRPLLFSAAALVCSACCSRLSGEKWQTPELKDVTRHLTPA